MLKFLRYSTYYLMLIMLFGIQACDVEDEALPSYIYIEDFEVETVTGEGSTSQNIKDAWVFINDQSFGLYELPATIPVLANGPQTVAVLAGIYNNGISAQRLPYPMYTDYTEEVDMGPLKRDTLNPVIRYKDNAMFQMEASFEAGNPFNLQVGDGIFTLINTPEEVFEGDRSLKVVIDSGAPGFTIVSNQAYALPTDGTPVFLEFDYKCTTDFEVRLYAAGSSESQEVVFLRAREDWNKFYVDLTQTLQVYLGFDIPGPFVIGFSDIEGEIDYGTLYLDNVKLIHL